MSDTSRRRSAADRNLLFGILALQLDFITRDDLIAAMNAWVLDKSKSLGQILAGLGKLRPDLLAALELLVDKHVQAHDDDPQRSLAAVASVSALRQELQQVADDDVQATLDYLPSAARTEGEDTGSFQSEGLAAPRLRYRILRPHARGGLGEVFVAEDTELHREVALKEIRKEHGQLGDSRGRFLLEAEITGGLEHPGIVPVYGLGTYDDGRPFYAMRFIKGDNLKEAIQRFHHAEGPQRDPGERNVAFRELLGRFVDVCNAVAYAHSRGVLHRDLKPGNVMLGRFGETLVVDWGLAKVVGRPETLPETADATLRPSSADSQLAATRMGTVVGTPAYMSPEQAAGRLDLLGPASDVYSLGATLYALLTGTAPFRGESDEIRRRVQRGEFARPRQVKPNLSPALEAVCLKAMNLRPEQRYGTAVKLAEDIEHWLADEPVNAWPEPLRVRAGRWARRHKPLVSGAAAALLVGLVALGAGVVWYQNDQAERAAAQARQDADKALREALAESARQQTAGDVRQALQQAAAGRGALQQVLAKEGGVRALLNNPALWQGQLLQAQLQLDKAQALLAHAGTGLDPALTEQLQRRKQELTQDVADQKLAVRLEQIRLDRSAFVAGKFDHARALREYRRAFANARLEVVAGEPEPAAARLGRSAIKEQLVAALDDWSVVARSADDQDLYRRLTAVARLADPDPWRNQIRAATTREGSGAMQGLADKLLADPPSLARQSPQMLDLVGQVLFLTKGDAVRWLRQAQVHHPSDYWLNFQLATVARKSKPGEAAGYFRAALAVRPHSTAAWTNLGVVLDEQNDLPGAVTAFEKALTIDAQFATAWNNLGATLRRQKRLPAALAAFRKALDVDSQNAHAWGNIGNILADQGHLPEAADAFHKALKIDPQLAGAWNGLGTVRREQNDLPGAEGAFRKALKFDPQNAPAWMNLGHVLRDRKDLRGSMDAYKKALTIAPESAEVLNAIGSALREQKDLPGAVNALRKALQINPQFAHAWENLGNALIDQNDLRGAVDAYRNSVKFDPQIARVWFGLGIGLHRQNDLPGAVDAYKKALKLDAKDPRMWYNLGNAVRDQKDPQGAIQAYRQALALQPDYPEANCNLGLVLQRLGQFRDALKYLEKGHQLGSRQPGWSVRSEQWVQLCRKLVQIQDRAESLAQGQAQPSGPVELLQLAQACRRIQRPNTAVRLYELAFTAQRALLEDLAGGHRSQAAAAAASAAAGRGLDADQLADDGKVKLRRQALDWFRADLKRLTQTVADYQAPPAAQTQPTASPGNKPTGQSKKSGAADLVLACDRLQRWQQDPDLAGVREDKELAKLPLEEQKSWRKLWNEVRALEKRARGCFTEKQLTGSLTAQKKEGIHEVKLQAGKTYVFDLESSPLDLETTAFFAFLRVEDANGKKLNENDDSKPGVLSNCRLVFTPKDGGTYRLVARAFQPLGMGAYVLRVREFVGNK